MKYLITESQLDRVIFIYLNNQRFIQIDNGGKIYFVNSKGDKYAQIRYDIDDGFCIIIYKLIKEISSFFSLQESDSEEVIGRWVENTLRMKVKSTLEAHYQTILLVENTLRMKVKSTCNHSEASPYMSRIPSE